MATIPIYYTYKDFEDNWEKDYLEYQNTYSSCTRDAFLKELRLEYYPYFDKDLFNFDITSLCTNIRIYPFLGENRTFAEGIWDIRDLLKTHHLTIIGIERTINKWYNSLESDYAHHVFIDKLPETLIDIHKRNVETDTSFKPITIDMGGALFEKKNAIDLHEFSKYGFAFEKSEKGNHYKFNIEKIKDFKFALSRIIDFIDNYSEEKEEAIEEEHEYSLDLSDTIDIDKVRYLISSGIIDYVKDNHIKTSNNKVAIFFSAVTGIKLETIRRNINEYLKKSESDKNPTNQTDKMEVVRNQLIKLGFNKPK